jgi:hypothetical protein
MPAHSATGDLRAIRGYLDGRTRAARRVKSPLDRAQQRAFTAVAGKRKPPRKLVSELWAIAARMARRAEG